MVAHGFGGACFGCVTCWQVWGMRSQRLPCGRAPRAARWARARGMPGSRAPARARGAAGAPQVQRRLLACRNQALGRTLATAADALAAASRAGEAAATAAEAADIVAAAYGEAAVQTAHARRASGRRAPRRRRVV